MKEAYSDPNSEHNLPGVGGGQGYVRGSGSATGDGYTPAASTTKTPIFGEDCRLRIIFKPQVTYTDEARANGVQGVVRLKVTFLATGKIGSISIISGLPFCLTGEAIKIAKQIKFNPEVRNAVPTTVTKTIEFFFGLH